ncbi:MAG TPA: NUDIX domain-containing protein [Candidatus Binataceae bacterium]|nr:NUDIX domain-containing protein [Candidatus Binataceae bacterium]
MATLARDLAGEMASLRTRLARPKVAVDTVLFAIRDGRLRCYLVRLKRGPHVGKWAFPGGLVRVGEMLEDAARRELRASAGIADCYLEQLFTFGDPTRDPRSHVVSVAYMALIDDPATVRSGSGKYTGSEWFDPGRMPPLAYDHALMAEYAVKRLKAKLEYTNIAANLLPATFTFAQLAELYGAVLDRRLDRRNFRRRIVAMGLLKRLPRERRGAHRPAGLYAFARRSLQAIEML